MSPVDAAVLVAAGVAISSYATAIGVGGGFLITPLLLILHPDVEPQFVTAASLSVVAVSSGLSAAVAARARHFDGPVVAMLGAVAVPAAVMGARGTELVPRDAFAFGISGMLLLLVAYLAWRPAAASSTFR